MLQRSEGEREKEREGEREGERRRERMELTEKLKEDERTKLYTVSTTELEEGKGPN